MSACVPPVVEPIIDAGPNPCEGQRCADQGVCAVVNGSVPVCVCNAGFFADGLTCKPVVAGAECDGVTCDGRGVCEVLAGMPNRPRCACDAQSVAAGPTTCVARPAPCDGVTCSGHGTCAVAGAMAVCLCNAGFRANGTSCEAVVVGQECSGVTCSGHGTCAVSNGAPLCSCEPGYDRLGTACVERPLADAGASVCAGVTCSGRGVCAVVGGTTPTCLCNAGYVASGTACALAGTSGGTLGVLAGVVGAGAPVDGPLATARLSLPVAVVRDPMGNLLVAEEGGVIRKVSASGVVSTLAGLTGVGVENRGYVNATGALARFGRLRPQSLAVDGAGNLFVMDSDNCALRQVTPAGVVTTFAGALPDSRGQPVCGADDVAPLDGTGTAARFVSSGGIYTLTLTRDAAGNLYTLQNRRGGASLYVRRISPAGVVTSTLISGITTPLLMASNSTAVTPDGLTLHVASNVGIGRVALPSGAWTNVATSPAVTRSYTSICATATGTVFVSAEALVTMSGVLRRSAWVVRVMGSMVVDVASSEVGADGYVDGPGPAARFRQGLALTCDDAGGRLLVADEQNNVIRAVDTTTNAVTTVVGIGASFGVALDGTGAAARFGSPARLASDSAGNWYLTDTAAHALRRVSSSGVVSTVAGQLGTSGSVDGTGGAARFNAPVGLTIDSADTLYVADRGRLRRITPAGVVTTLATSATGLNTVHSVRALAVDSMSQLLFYAAGDNGNFLGGNRLMRVSTTGGTPLQVDGQTDTYELLAIDSTRRRLYLGSASGGLQCVDLVDPMAVPLPRCVNVSLPGFSNTFESGLSGQLTVGPTGTLYVTNRNSTVVKVLTVAPFTATVAAGAPGAFGVELGPLPARLFRPQGLAINPVTQQLGVVSDQDGALLVTTGFTP